MKNLYSFLILTLISLHVSAQEEASSESRSSTFGITLIQENAFGFYPVIYGAEPISARL